jgi:hypothetical protein
MTPSERNKLYLLNNPKTHWMCSSGGCRKKKYLDQSECFKCWLGTKWGTMKQRTENRNGHYSTWDGLPLGMTRKEFVAWGLSNPPPDDMVMPSVDRINDALGYVFGNIQWLERDQNSRKGALKQHANYRANAAKVS